VQRLVISVLYYKNNNNTKKSLSFPKEAIASLRLLFGYI
jgi:hypothetical protein